MVEGIKRVTTLAYGLGFCSKMLDQYERNQTDHYYSLEIEILIFEYYLLIENYSV